MMCARFSPSMLSAQEESSSGNVEFSIHSTLCPFGVHECRALQMASGSKRALFDEDDDDVDEIPKLKRGAAKKVGEENPLSFFSFGSAPSSSLPPSHASSNSHRPSTSLDSDDDDDDFFTSPPSSLKKPAASRFDSSEEDDLFAHSKPKSILSDANLAFQDALKPDAVRTAPLDASKAVSSSTSEKQRISALEEQLAKANRTIKKLQEKEKAVRRRCASVTKRNKRALTRFSFLGRGAT